MTDLYRIENLRLALPDMTAKPLFGPAPRIEILKGDGFVVTTEASAGMSNRAKNPDSLWAARWRVQIGKRRA